MTVSELTKNLKISKHFGNLNLEVSGLSFDSRKTETGHLFIAIKGTTSDGHDYIETVINNGATAIICEQLPKEINSKICYVQTADSSDALGKVAAVFFDLPSEKMIVVGVTGTNGKTTVASLLYYMFKKLGYKVGLLSTVCNYVDEEAVPSTHTTPDPIEMQSLMARMAKKSCQYVFMEVSSHAINQKRISGICFDGGIFTNLTRDHLDYHKTMDEYLKAKKCFFDNLPSHAFAITNLDDKNGKVMLQNTQANKYAYALQTSADFKGKVIEESFEGMTININNKEVSTHFVGRFNASNLLAVYGAAYLLRIPSDDILLVLSTLLPVNGRFDSVRSNDGRNAIVDYAHTPDALENVIETINQIRRNSQQKNTLITVVGCGGNRDKGKRPIMAKEAVKGSDKVIITTDNPRFEEPSDIIKDMLDGLDETQKAQVLVIEDRKQAIKTACMLAKQGDVILVAGKGHENYQEIKGVKHHFDDKEIVSECFK